MPTLRSAEDILTTELKEIYSAERQLSRALPKLAKKAENERLRRMLEERVEQSSTLIEQIDDALEDLQVSKGRQKNVAAEGLIEDLNQHLEEIEDERLMDPLMLAGMQKVEHYCIAAWGTAAAVGRLLGAEKAVEAMERALNDGKEFDDRMTELAESEVNRQMLDGEDSGSEGGKRTPRRGKSR